MNKHLLTTALIALLCTPAFAADDAPLRARGEVNWRPGQERSILMTEFWVPFMQDERSVFYGDLRLMGDNTDNREGNVGLGYRTITVDVPLLGDGVVGVHGWLDQRITARKSHFQQMTLGTEWLGERFDILANGYVPLSDEEYHQVSNPNAGAAVVAGTGVYVDTNQIVLEEPQAGFDIELGLELGSLSPAIAAHSDAVRLYGGGYYFNGENTESISGWRLRLAADVTSDIQLGARFQSDDVRGSQGFLDATIRFPFGHKQSFRKQGLYGRLDDAPERDIDIVTGDVVADPGQRVALLNATTGQAQEIIHVDNSGANGDGSAESPFNNLSDAQTAVSDYGIIYVHTGSGTGGQNTGITLNKTGQQLIGAGTDLTFEAAKYTTANGATISPLSTTLIESSIAPTITNGAGEGVIVSADNVTVSGITVDGASTIGVSIGTQDGVTVRGVTAINNGTHGIAFYNNAGVVDTVTIEDNVVDLNTSHGILINNHSGGVTQTVNISNNTITNSGTHGLYVVVEDNNSRVETANLSGNMVSDTASSGIYLRVRTQAAIGHFNATDNVSDNSSVQGFYLQSQGGGDIERVTLIGNAADNNERNGFALLTSDAGATLDNIYMYNNTADGNERRGYLIYASNNSSIDGVTLIENTSSDPTTSNGIGFWVYTLSAGTVSDVTLTDNVALNSWGEGFLVEADGAGSAVNNVTLTGNRAQGGTEEGFLFLAEDDGDITGAVFNRNIATGNSTYGVSVYDDSSAGGIQIDMGGGALGATGYNSIYSNSLEEMFVDLDGATLKAEQNWWGAATGLAPGEIAAGSDPIDATPYLTSDPN